MRSIFRKRKQDRQPSCTAVIVAAGTASRMQGVDKMMAQIGDKPVPSSHNPVYAYVFADRVEILSEEKESEDRKSGKESL